MGPEGVFYYCSFVCTVEKQPQSLLATSSCLLQNSRAALLTAAGAAHPPRPCLEMLLVPARPQISRARTQQGALGAGSHLCFLVHEDGGALNPQGRWCRGPRKVVQFFLFLQPQELCLVFGIGHGSVCPQLSIPRCCPWAQSAPCPPHP